MRFKKGELAKKLPAFSQVICAFLRDPHRMTHRMTDYVLPRVSTSILMGFRRENVPMPPGKIYWCVDMDGWLQIHPAQDKDVIIKVRYLPPEREV